MTTGRNPEATIPTEGLTMAALRVLGFSDRPPEFASTKLGYDMGGWELTAQEMVNRHLVPIVQVSGVIHTPRVLGAIDIQMLPTFKLLEQVAAFLVFGLEEYRADLNALPSWWAVGEDNLDLHPVVQQRKQNEERVRAYHARPHCVIDIEHARLFRRKLREAMKALACEEAAILTFDGQVLRTSLAGHDIAVLASGDAWPHAISWPLSSETRLPGRFSGETVTLGYFDGKLDVENHLYSGSEAVY